MAPSMASAGRPPSSTSSTRAPCSPGAGTSSPGTPSGPPLGLARLAQLFQQALDLVGFGLITVAAGRLLQNRDCFLHGEQRLVRGFHAEGELHPDVVLHDLALAHHGRGAKD